MGANESRTTNKQVIPRVRINETLKEMKDLEDANINLENQNVAEISSINKNITIQNQYKDKLKADILTLTKKLYDSNCKQEELKAKCDDLDKQLLEKSNECLEYNTIKDQTARINEALKKIQDLEEENRILKSQNLNKNVFINTLKNNITMQSEYNNKLKANNLTLTKELCDSNYKQEELKAKCDDLNKQLLKKSSECLEYNKIKDDLNKYNTIQALKVIFELYNRLLCTCLKIENLIKNDARKNEITSIEKNILDLKKKNLELRDNNKNCDKSKLANLELAETELSKFKKKYDKSMNHLYTLKEEMKVNAKNLDTTIFTCIHETTKLIDIVEKEVARLEPDLSALLEIKKYNSVVKILEDMNSNLEMMGMVSNNSIDHSNTSCSNEGNNEARFHFIMHNVPEEHETKMSDRETVIQIIRSICTIPIQDIGIYRFKKIYEGSTPRLIKVTLPSFSMVSDILDCRNKLQYGIYNYVRIRPYIEK